MSSEKIALLFFIIVSIYYIEAQDDTCVMPDGLTKSKCVRFHYCNQLFNLYKEHKGKPPEDVRNYITKHGCSQGVCCPDHAIKVETTTTTTTPEPILTIGELNLNLDQIRNHPNYHLINSKTCGVKIAQRIVGGVTAELTEFPWAVLLGYRDERIDWDCGGNLINERYVLTAAHCIKKSLYIARLGEHTISTAPDCDSHGSCVNTQDILIQEKIIHPWYSKYTAEHDVALLKLSSAADTRAYNVKTICLPSYEKADIERIKHKNFTISGWGKSDNGRKSDVLLKSEVRLQDANQCLNSLAKATQKVAVFEENICAGGFDKLHACRGDSGGGLTASVVIERKVKVYLYGLLARGVPCNTTGVYPDVYMNIKKYLGWILDNMS